MKLLIKTVIIPGFIACAFSSHAQEISLAGGDWVINLTPAIIAGENPIGDVTSATNQCVVDIKGKKVNDWEVTIQKQDVNWDNNLVVYAVVTDPGSGPGSLGGGTELAVNDSPQTFFWGGKNRNNIEVQYRLSSITPPAVGLSFTTNLVYTVTEVL